MSTPLTSTLLPKPQLRRLIQLNFGLVLFGASLALLVTAELGLDPWDVFHQGLARTTGARLGYTVVATSFVVLLAWIPIRQRPGIGTILNAVLVGLVFEVTIELLPESVSLVWRWVLLVAAIVLNAIATGLYVGAGLGPGPRDGLMTGIAARGHPLRVVRTSIEVVVLLAGWILGGTIGIGTLAYALGIGPLVHIALPYFTIADSSDLPAKA